MTTLQTFLARIEVRKQALGLVDTPAAVDAMRNKGGQRSPAKRELLRRIDERAADAGRAPIKAYY